LAVYPFISDADVLKDLLNQLLQGGAIVVSLLLYLSLKDKLEKHYLFIIGTLFFATAFGFYWFGGDIGLEMIWTWQTPMAAGIILISLQSSEIFTRLNP
jgi:Na+/melibiose symporter-like transporter